MANQLKWTKVEKGEYSASHGDNTYLLRWRKTHKWQWILTANIYYDIKSGPSKKSVIEWINNNL